MSIVQTSIYKPSNGAKLADIYPDIRSITWRVNDRGIAQIFMPYNDPACNPDLLRIGNLITFKLPTETLMWGGVIDMPFDQDYDGVYVTAYSGERLLNFRRTSPNLKVGGTPGSIFKAVLNDLARNHSTIIDIGTLFEGGDPFSKVYNVSNPMVEMQSLAMESGQDWAVEPYFTDAGYLRFQGLWWSERGYDRSERVALIESDTTRFRRNQTGDIVNTLYIAKPSSRWNSERVSTSKNEASISQYGVREGDHQIVTGVFGLVSDDEAKAIGRSLVNILAQPQDRLTAVTTGVSPAKLLDYHLGDTVLVWAFAKGGDQWGINGDKYRVRAKAWEPGGLYSVTLEVV